MTFEVCGTFEADGIDDALAFLASHFRRVVLETSDTGFKEVPDDRVMNVVVRKLQPPIPSTPPRS